MARKEHTKEDLLRQASGLADRAELAIPDFDQSIVVGFRQHQAASVYFGEDPAYHWNGQGELRRAYVSGQLVKAEAGRLVSMQKHRTAAVDGQRGQVQMIRHEFTQPEQSQFLAAVEHRLARLQTALSRRQFELVGQASSSHQNVVQMTQTWLEQLPRPLRVAAVPHVGG